MAKLIEESITFKISRMTRDHEIVNDELISDEVKRQLEMVAKELMSDQGPLVLIEVFHDRML